MSRHVPPLPAELSDTIIDILSGDWRSLAACALASSVLRPRASYHLCENITLNVPEIRRNSDMHHFMRIFVPGSLLAELPISLHIRGGRTFRSLPTVLQLDHLRNLRSLRLSDFDISIPRLRSLYIPLRHLEELHIYRLRRVLPGEVEIPDFDEHASEPHRHLQHSGSCLKTIRMYFHVLDRGAVYLCQAVGDDFGSMRSPPVSLKYFSYHLPWKHTISGWTQVLANSTRSLSEMRLTIRRPLSEADEAGLFSVLSECSRVRAITLYISYAPKAPEILPACIGSLTTWLSPAPLPAFTRTLKNLCIIIEGPVQHLFLGSLGSEVLAKLAQALLPDAYPSLEALRVVHHRWKAIPPENPSSALSEEKAVGSIAQALTPLRAAGVRVDVGTIPSSSEMTHAYGGPASAFF